MSGRAIMPVLEVSDMAASLAFYRRLGFQGTVWGEPPTFAILRRGDAAVALDLSQREGPIPVNQWWAAYVYVDDVDAVYAEFVAAGVEGLEPPDNRFYGCRDFDVVDPDEHRLAIGQELPEES